MQTRGKWICSLEKQWQTGPAEADNLFVGGFLLSGARRRDGIILTAAASELSNVTR